MCPCSSNALNYVFAFLLVLTRCHHESMCLRTHQEAAVVFDKISGKSKGYGFVTFTSAEAAMRALVDTVKIIDGRQTQVRSLRGSQPHVGLAESLRVIFFVLCEYSRQCTHMNFTLTTM